MDYRTIEDAFYFVSGAPQWQNTAVVSRSTGKVYYASAMLDEDELPDDAEENDDYVGIPHKNDLDLGRHLVMEFIDLHCPQETGLVRSIFSRRGAYARYKAFLSDRKLLDKWYAFENEKTKEALLKWCEETGLDVQA